MFNIAKVLCLSAVEFTTVKNRTVIWENTLRENNFVQNSTVGKALAENDTECFLL